MLNTCCVPGEGRGGEEDSGLPLEQLWHVQPCFRSFIAPGPSTGGRGGGGFGGFGGGGGGGGCCCGQG